MASSPHLPQRMPVSRPARASSKKCFSVSTFSVTAEETPEHRGRVAPEGVRQAGARAVDLTRAGLAAKLGDDLRDLRGARGADGVALGLEAAGRVHRNLASKAGPTLFRGDTSRARL